MTQKNMQKKLEFNKVVFSGHPSVTPLLHPVTSDVSGQLAIHAAKLGESPGHYQLPWAQYSITTVDYSRVVCLY